MRERRGKRSGDNGGQQRSERDVGAGVMSVSSVSVRHFAVRLRHSGGLRRYLHFILGVETPDGTAGGVGQVDERGM